MLPQHGRLTNEFSGRYSSHRSYHIGTSVNCLLGSYMRANDHLSTIPGRENLLTGFYFIHFDTDHFNLV